MDHGLFEAATPWAALAICLVGGALFLITVAGKTPLAMVTGRASLPLRRPQVLVAALYAVLSLAGLIILVQTTVCRNVECF